MSTHVPGLPAGAPPWVTAELIAETLRVLQPCYTTPLTPEDALEMLLNVKLVLTECKHSQKE